LENGILFGYNEAQNAAVGVNKFVPTKNYSGKYKKKYGDIFNPVVNYRL
jgi:hypothetical protein